MPPDAKNNLMELRSVYYDLITMLGIFLRHPLCGPRIVQINISENCNLDCSICNRSSMRVSGLIDGDKALALADELYMLGAQEIFFHGFGEPACHPRLAEMILHIRTHMPRFRQHIVTNGTWDSQPLRDAILSGRVQVRFSMHAGDEETWQKIHPHDNLRYFFQAGENLRFLASRAPESLEVLFVICKDNWHKIPEMASYALQQGVRRILFRPMRLFRDRHGRYMNDKLLPSAEEYGEAARAIDACRQKYRGRLSVQSVSFDQTHFDPEYGRPSSRSFYYTRSCYIGYVLAVIERDGSVWGCLPESSAGEPLGNVNETSFRKIWYGEKYRAFRKHQLFPDKSALDLQGCHSYCQHLETNIRLNHPWKKNTAHEAWE